MEASERVLSAPVLTNEAVYKKHFVECEWCLEIVSLMLPGEKSPVSAKHGMLER
jgi:hypothetical protein